QRPPDVAGLEPEHRAGVVVDRRDAPAAVDDELADRRLLERRLDRRGRRRLPFFPRRAAPAPARLEPGRRVSREPRARWGVPQRLRLAKREEASSGQREVEIREDALLRGRVEVHERVPREEEVDPGDRRVLHEVVAAEDDTPADVVPEAQAVVGAREVLRPELVWHDGQLLCRVRGMAGLIERLLVDVGGGDLYPLL